MPHSWLIATSAPELPVVSLLEATLEAGEPPLSLHADLRPTGAAWESLGFGPAGHPPCLYLEAEAADGPDAWLARAEIARWRRSLAASPPCPGRREAQRRLEATRWLLAIHLLPAPPATSSLWAAGERLATALSTAERGVLWVAGEGCFLDGLAVSTWC